MALKPISFPNIQAELRARTGAGVFNVVGAGGPVSGNNGAASGFGVCGKGSIYTDVNTGLRYVNEGTKEDPYWTPLEFFDPRLLAVTNDFRDLVGKAHADTAAFAFGAGSGVRMFGDGITATDSGVVVTMDENGPVATLTTTATNAKLVALSGLATNASALPYQPDTNGPMVVDTLVAMSAALTLRAFWLGFLGTAADALVPPASGSATTITLVQDDMAGLFYSAGLTAATRLFAPTNKSDAAPTQTTASCDTLTDFPAFGTYVRLRVQIETDGSMTCFANKIQIFRVANALDTNEEVVPVLAVISTSAAVKAMLVKYFRMWGVRG